MLQWLRARRRKEIASAPFPADWRNYLLENVRLFAELSPEQQTRLQADLRVFAAEKSWEGCGGLTLTDEIRATVSALACLLTLERNHNFYPNVESILIYPTSYTSVIRTPNPGGFIEVGRQARLGEAWHTGPIILSWEDVIRGARGQAGGNNVALHEFAHKLDMDYGAADGVPQLESDEQFESWAEVMSREYAHLVTHIEHHGHTVLSPYAATNPAEFFAVSTEVFFERPHQMQLHLPSLYTVLAAFYKQDPAARTPNEFHGFGAD